MTVGWSVLLAMVTFKAENKMNPHSDETDNNAEHCDADTCIGVN